VGWWSFVKRRQSPGMGFGWYPYLPKSKSKGLGTFCFRCFGCGSLNLGTCLDLFQGACANPLGLVTVHVSGAYRGLTPYRYHICILIYALVRSLVARASLPYLSSMLPLNEPDYLERGKARAPISIRG